METWYKEFCPECDSSNWINNGDETDLTVVDIEAIKCHNCGEIFFLGFEDEEDLMFEKGIDCKEDLNWVDGLQYPI